MYKILRFTGFLNAVQLQLNKLINNGVLETIAQLEMKKVLA